MTISGKYRVYGDGKLISEFPNVITNSGKIAIGKYLADERTSWGDVMVFGVGDSTPNATNNKLDLEVWRESVDMKTYVTASGQIVARSIVPSSLVSKIYEMGLYCTLTTETTTSSGPIITGFDQASEVWSSGVFDTANRRAGSSSLKLSPTTGTPASSSTQMYGSISVYPNTTIFNLGYQILSGTADLVKIQLKSSADTYREYSFVPTASSEYQIESWGLSDTTLTGNAAWTEFSEIYVEVEGNGEFMFDVLTGFVPPEGSVLVSRALVSHEGNPFIDKEQYKELQAEYIIDLGI
jgi:hypothetical protein